MTRRKWTPVEKRARVTLVAVGTFILLFLYSVIFWLPDKNRNNAIEKIASCIDTQISDSVPYRNYEFSVPENWILSTSLRTKMNLKLKQVTYRTRRDGDKFFHTRAVNIVQDSITGQIIAVDVQEIKLQKR